MVPLFFFTAGFANQWVVQPQSSDEFNYPAGTAISSSKWTFASNSFSSSAVYQFTNIQYNVPADSHLTEYNLRTTDSSIQIVARKLGSGYLYTSAGLGSRCKMSMTRGKIEIRLKPPGAALSGLWPSFFMLGDTSGPAPACAFALPWPACGEIDPWEYRSSSPTTYITGGYCNTACGATESATIETGNQAGVWRVYTCEKDSEAVTYWYRNDNDAADVQRGLVTKSLSGCSCFAYPMYYNLRMAVEGVFAGPINCEFPETLEVDYVRAYAPASTSTDRAAGPRASEGGDFTFLAKRSEFRFVSPYASHTQITLHCLDGSLAALLFDGFLPAGTHYFPRPFPGMRGGVFIARVKRGAMETSYRTECF